MAKTKCWFCDRKVEETFVFLPNDKIKHIFSDKGVFSQMEVRDKEIKDWVVCDVCAGLIKYLASETTQVKSVLKTGQVAVKSGIDSVVSGVSSGVSGITKKVKKKDT
ncbi:MAG: hypothetical protein ACFFD4_25895 [Candidatus Odinarchaeota archaeon]